MPKTDAGEGPEAPHKGRLAAELGLRPPSVRLRSKILSLTSLAVALPVLVVGGFSYLTARNILIDKVSADLETRVTLASQTIREIFGARFNDTEVFARSFVISQNIRLWNAARQQHLTDQASAARAEIHNYLGEVHNRFAEYREFQVRDAQQNTVMRIPESTSPTTETIAQESATPDRSLRSDSYATIERHGEELLLRISRNILDQGDQRIGSLETTSQLNSVWPELVADLRAGSGDVRLLQLDGRPLFDTRRPPPSSANDLQVFGTQRAIAGETGVGQYHNVAGDRVLGAYTFIQPAGLDEGLAMILEVETRTAFEAVHRLRRFSLLTALIALILVALGSYWLVVNISRPIELLTRGAEAVAGGDLGGTIPEGSNDEIGYLTQIFNLMTRELRDSSAELERISITDDLTGLHNRRYLNQVFTVELARAKRENASLAVLLMDLDRFKDFNDRFGHPKGDALLTKMGELLRSHLRPTDRAMRYGGEEFLVLLPGTGLSEAMEIATRFREAYSEADMAEDPTVHCTVSLGVATWPRDGEDQTKLIKAADLALYEAKDRGRNNAVAYSGLEQPERPKAD